MNNNNDNNNNDNNNDDNNDNNDNNSNNNNNNNNNNRSSNNNNNNNNNSNNNDDNNNSDTNVNDKYRFLVSLHVTQPVTGTKNIFKDTMKTLWNVLFDNQYIRQPLIVVILISFK